jgi:hypothetical protein
MSLNLENTTNAYLVGLNDRQSEAVVSEDKRFGGTYYLHLQSYNAKAMRACSSQKLGLL